MLFNFCLIMISVVLYNNYYMNISLLLLMMMTLMMMMNNSEFEYMNYWVYEDSLSQILMILTLFIIYLMSLNDYKMKNYQMSIIDYILLISLIFCFFSSNLLLMYVFFEISLIPLMTLILIKGSSPERYLSSMYLVLFTLSGSLPFLLILLVLEESCSSFGLKKVQMMFSLEGLIWILMIFIFLIKMPMYGVHIWLPKAHVEAPVTGSMILAGLLLKLGGFGLFRLIYFLKVPSINFIKVMVTVISLLGSFMVSGLCFRQTDIKLLVAYSSIVHMGMVLSGFFSFSILGSMGVIGAMVGHGFCSSGLFYLANWFYERYNTRSMLLMKGAFQCYNWMVYWWMLFVVINMGVPMFMNFYSEVLLVYSIMKISVLNMLVLCFLLMSSVFYNLCLFTRLGHGFSWSLKKAKSNLKLEMIVSLVHFLPLIMYLLNVLFLLEWVF